MLRGTVKFFNEEKGFGFITREEEGGLKDYFFHIFNRRRCRAGDHEVEFFGESHQPERRYPLPGELIVFEPAPGRDDKPQASPWAHGKDYFMALREFAVRPVYRMLLVNGESKRELWQGTSRLAATVQHPKNEDGEILVGNGHLVFELLSSDCTWEPCADPRL